MKTLIGTFTDISLPDSGRLEVYLYRDTISFELISARFAANLTVNKDDESLKKLIKNLYKMTKGGFDGGLPGVTVQLYRKDKKERKSGAKKGKGKT
jgi:hypothetical protein